MYLLRIEHSVPDFEGWKKAFDSDPLGREKSGVRAYRILQPVDDDKYVLIDLEFNILSEAEAVLGKLRELWKRVEGQVMFRPAARIVKLAETKSY